MENKSLIFIPDISGFTKFVNATEIEHSNIIISTLLENIINLNELNLKVSEIEGDAVLFYRFGQPPELKDVIEQARKMFVNFHTGLNSNDGKRACNCKACATAVDLTLKFITHYGELKEIKIQQFQKLIGRDLILAHRLLKNNIPSHEYLLFSEEYLATQGDARIAEDWASFEQNNEEIEEFGEVRTKYVSLTPLRAQVSN